MDLEDVIDQLEEAVLADDVQEAVNAFLEQAIPTFDSLTDEQLSSTTNLGAEEQQLGWYDSYKTYVALLEDRVLASCLDELPGCSRQDIYTQLMAIAEAPAVEAEAADRRRTVKFLLSAFEYDSFLNLMKDTLRRRRIGLDGPVGAQRRAASLQKEEEGEEEVGVEN
mmetsp:Transcript_32635/g.69996  ORF Transcript_32635/g.69996 Transcript_32635/m.69996 type:complete len:167 (-) Transcript_32635:357-857(-)